MSGVEVGGLALAVLPLLITAAEHTKSRRLKPRQAEFIENLAFEVTLLNMSLTKLAKELVGLPDELRESLSMSRMPQPSQGLLESWKSSEVVHALKTRLGDKLDTFVVTLGAILHCLDDLLETESLNLSYDGAILAKHQYAKLQAICHRTISTPINAWSHRVRFAIHEERVCRPILSRIKENNTQLERIVLRSSDAIFAPPEQSKESRVVSSPYLQLCPLMHTLYVALATLWSCDCHRRHDIRLCLLQHRSRRQDLIAGTGDGDIVSFNMLVSHNSEEKEPYGHWLEIQLCVAFQEHMVPHTTRGVRFDLGSTPSTVGSRDGIKMITESTGAIGAFPGRVRLPAASPSNTGELCRGLLQADRNVCPLQILLEGGSLWHLTSKQSSRTSSRALSVTANDVDTSLATLLRAERKLRPKEKRILSVILANSLLHFSESPWMSKEWSKEHITFFPTAEKGLLDIRRPYLSTDFQDTAAEEDTDDLFRIHPNPSLLALGILLLEIELGSPIERGRGADDLDYEGNPTVNTDYLVALRLFEEIADDIYINQQHAVSACLNCDFYDEETMKPSLDDYEFRQAVYNNVVKPLEQELYNAYELKVDDLGLDLI